MGEASSGPPRLDHVSLMGELTLFEELGFRVSPIADSPDHCRVFLEGTYLEVVPPTDGAWGVAARGWFLRPDDPGRSADLLRAAGLEVEGPVPYVGEDGSWLDVQVAGKTDAALPVLTRRGDLIAADWPPRVVDPHPNGARRLVALRLRMRQPDRLLRLLAALGLGHRGLATVLLPGREEIELEAGSEGPNGIVELAFEREEDPPLLVQTRPIGH